MTINEFMALKADLDKDLFNKLRAIYPFGVVEYIVAYKNTLYNILQEYFTACESLKKNYDTTNSEGFK
jgi:hypothetical protein